MTMYARCLKKYALTASFCATSLYASSLREAILLDQEEDLLFFLNQGEDPIPDQEDDLLRDSAEDFRLVKNYILSQLRQTISFLLQKKTFFLIKRTIVFLIKEKIFFLTRKRITFLIKRGIFYRSGEDTLLHQ